MSWSQPWSQSQPDRIIPAHDPKDIVESFALERGEWGRKVLTAFNEIDPLSAKNGTDSIQYIGCADRFMEGLGDRKPEHLSPDEIEELVRKSFSPQQSQNGNLKEGSIQSLATAIRGRE